MIGKTVTVATGRPLGTYHPKHPDMYTLSITFI